jgi:C-3',4' desaturase CrtD
MPVSQSDVVVVGGGIAGLSAAALLALDGAVVTVLEQHNIVGGCASSFVRKGMKFDVGATLAGGFGRRGIHRRCFAALGVEIEANRIDPAMIVHLPGAKIVRYGDTRWRAERVRIFGHGAEKFWNEQERVAGAAWDFAARFPMLPADRRGLGAFMRALRPRQLQLARYLGTTIGARLPNNDLLRRFVEAQLLITSQASADETDYCYGATALDLARAGVYHLPQGLSQIATQLARGVRKRGGRIAYKTRASAIRFDGEGRVSGVETDRGFYAAREIISSLPVGDTAALLDEDVGATLRERAEASPGVWGSFMAYVGLREGAVPDDAPLHHQVVSSMHGLLGEGRSVFISLSLPGERAPGKMRALTMSTHTHVGHWELAALNGEIESEKARYGELLLNALETVFPGAREYVSHIEFGTPLTFARYTGRSRGFVGGLPQRPWHANVLAFSHVSGVAGLRLCGDTTFPGQSTVGAALSGMAAARASVFSKRSPLKILC